jgi:hypothetical protein
LPVHKPGTAFLIVLLTLIVLNKHFYLFLAGERGKMFALAAIPFHLLYFLFSAAAFMLALVRHRLGMIDKRSAIHAEAPKAKATTP